MTDNASSDPENQQGSSIIEPLNDCMSATQFYE